MSAVQETSDAALTQSCACIAIGNPPKCGSGMRCMRTIGLDAKETTNDHPPAPQRPLYARFQCPRAREGKDAARRRRDPRSRGFGRARSQGRRRVSKWPKPSKPAVSARAKSSFASTASIRPGMPTIFPLPHTPRPTRSWCRKCRAPDTLELIGRRLLDMGTHHKTRVWAMIETPLAIFNVLPIAAAASDSETRCPVS